MKLIYLFIPIIVVSLIVTAFRSTKDIVKKIYAFKQASLPGIKPNFSNENDIISSNEQIKKQEYRPSYNYWIYFEHSSSETIKITDVWLNGIRYEYQTETVKSLPVYKLIFTGLEHNDTTVLVPTTSNKVLQVVLKNISEKKAPVSNSIKKLVKENELLICYELNGKKYYKVIKEIKELQPDVRV